MANPGRSAILVMVLLCILRLSLAQGCPTIAGYTFYALQDVEDKFNLREVPQATQVTDIAAACDNTPRCNSFTTTGRLAVTPMEPTFIAFGGASSQCEGIYIAHQRTLSGLVLPEGVDVSTMRKDSSKKVKDMQALTNAAGKVAAKLLEQGINPRSARSIDRAILVKAFEEERVPLSQWSETDGSYTFENAVAALTYPEWDSRSANGTAYNFISPVKDQGGCGSCVAFAATAAAETAVAVGSGTPSNDNNFSEQWLFFCNGIYFPDCSYGWYGSQAAYTIARLGIPMETNYPYQASPSCSLVNPPEVRVGGVYKTTTFTDINLAKQHIRDYGGVMTFFAVYNDFFNWNPTLPPYVWDGVSPLAGYHEVFTMGYNDTGAYWTAKNSWGTGWGDGGFFRISYTANVGFMSASGSEGIIGLSWFSNSTCGDGQCLTAETCSNCPQDCGICVVCGDGICSAGETCSSCPSDCGYQQPDGSFNCCGNGVCNTGESCASCPGDCGVCPYCNRNSICEPALGEKCVSGTTGCADCGSCNGNYCGDGKCTAPTTSKPYNETCKTCPTDCGTCGDTKGFCGDGVCSSSRSETSTTCPYDCGKGRKLALSSFSTSTGVDGGADTNANAGGVYRRSLRGKIGISAV